MHIRRFEGCTVLVSGGASGIGRACAERFAAEGARVMIADRVAADETIASIAASGGTAGATLCDLRSTRQVDAAIGETVARFGRIDCAINVAGISLSIDVLALDDERFLEEIDVNLTGTLRFARAAARQMVSQGKGGSIVAVSSVGSRLASGRQAGYGASKAGVNALVRELAIALAPHAIRVNALAPGPVETPLSQGLLDDAARQTILSRTPLGRMAAPKEMAAVAAFLASEDASYVSGHTLFADGGRLALNITMPAEA